MKQFFTLAMVFFSSVLWAQDPITIQHGCNFKYKKAVPVGEEFYTFDPSDEASVITHNILQAMGGLSESSFILKEANVPNALATTLGKNRYVLYSLDFLEKFKGDKDAKWAAYIVLAHEIGHHLNNHNFAEKDLKVRKKMELEADRFAGSVCRSLGATLNETMAALESMKLEGETATHPTKSARVAAVANGWKKQDELIKKNNPSIESAEAEPDNTEIPEKIFQRYHGLDISLIRAYKRQEFISNFSSDYAVESTILMFKVLNTGNGYARFVIDCSKNESAPVCIVEKGIETKADRIEERLSFKNEKNGQKRVFLTISPDNPSIFYVVFYDLSFNGKIADLRIPVVVDDSVDKKTLVFKNIPVPYESER